MEEKIYERQVTKQSLSFRVVDQQQIERHFTMNELAELYTFEPDLLDDPSEKKSKKATPMLPKVKMHILYVFRSRRWAFSTDLSVFLEVKLTINQTCNLALMNH